MSGSGTRFPDMTEVYSSRLRKIAREEGEAPGHRPVPRRLRLRLGPELRDARGDQDAPDPRRRRRRDVNGARGHRGAARRDGGARASPWYPTPPPACWARRSPTRRSWRRAAQAAPMLAAPDRRRRRATGSGALRRPAYFPGVDSSVSASLSRAWISTRLCQGIPAAVFLTRSSAPQLLACSRRDDSGITYPPETMKGHGQEDPMECQHPPVPVLVRLDRPLEGADGFSIAVRAEEQGAVDLEVLVVRDPLSDGPARCRGSRGSPARIGDDRDHPSQVAAQLEIRRLAESSHGVGAHMSVIGEVAGHEVGLRQEVPPPEVLRVLLDGPAEGLDGFLPASLLGQGAAVDGRGRRRGATAGGGGDELVGTPAVRVVAPVRVGTSAWSVAAIVSAAEFVGSSPPPGVLSVISLNQQSPRRSWNPRYPFRGSRRSRASLNL